MISENESSEDFTNYLPNTYTYLDYDWEIFDQAGLEHIPALVKVTNTGEIELSKEGEQSVTTELANILGEN